MRVLLLLLTFACVLFFSFSCTKPSDVPQQKTDSVTKIDSSSIAIKNEWRCTIDGKIYSGTVDTSFLQLSFGPSAVDSVVVAVGTTPDKKAHVLFNIAMNRKNFPATGVNNAANSFLVFDTSTFNRATSFISGAPSIMCRIDSANGAKIAAACSGTLTDRSGQHTFTGNFTCTLNTGNKDPNKFECQLEVAKQAGYFTNACFSANTLILNGLYYRDLTYKNFRLLVRTGGTIKPGTYKSSDGDVNIYVHEPGYSGNFYYVDDTTSSGTIIIDSVLGNVVKGHFSGASETKNRIQSGTFVCRVPNYTPQPNAFNRWSFSASIGYSFGVYNCFAGNVLSASRTSKNGRNYLTVTGQSDNGASAFKIVVSSINPIGRGNYELDAYSSNTLDSLYFKSGIKTWDGTVPHLWAILTPYSNKTTTLFIESIDNTQVTGTFIGDINNNLEDAAFGVSSFREIHKAKFNATF